MKMKKNNKSEMKIEEIMKIINNEYNNEWKYERKYDIMKINNKKIMKWIIIIMKKIMK